MRKLMITMMLAFMLVGCSSKTQYGQCVGISGQKQHNLIYKVDTTNLVVSVIFGETLIVPIVYTMDYIWCPVGVKDSRKTRSNR